ncbi:hypothetical protein MAR_030775 [Mya arenaria]|uniref:Uncharacterized protein n=2 Tax=Mya arenaria TaxID=6604 RepID=A0ABY7FA36_MYAAR|nr:hypothetical protein MAR_030737 [Mya arenaria]WAR16181.1 hypothetical protein MAR_030775 [Mya arenaria]
MSAWGAGSRVSVTSSAQLNIDSTQNDPVGGDISLDGNAILIKTHEAIYYWDASRSHDYIALLQQPGDKVPYIHEHQGESVCWDATDSGYYTLGEGKNEPLYHYVRV